MPEPTPEAKLLESLYRGKSAKRSPNLKQKSINRAYNKPSANKAKALEGSRVSPSVIAKSKLRQLKTSSAQNISKFGGGVKARLGGALAGAKAVAVKQGAKSLALGKLATSSKFLVGANSVPGLALLVGNYVVWKKNIQDIKKIYDFGNTPVNIDSVPTKILINEAPPPPYTGGQMPVKYFAYGSFASKNFSSTGCDVKAYWRSSSAINSQEVESFVPDNYGGLLGIQTRSGYVVRLAAITLSRLQDNYSGKLGSGNFILFRAQSEPCANQTAPTYGNSPTIEKVVREDGQPDTGGDPSSTGEPQYSTGGVSNTTIINNYITNNNTITPDPPLPPKKQSGSTTSKNRIDRIERVPTQVESPVVTQKPDLLQQRESITDSPPVVVKDPSPNDIEKKPAPIYKKTTRYPTERELQEINEVIKKNREQRAIKIDFDAEIDPITLDGLPSIGESQQRNRDSIIDQYEAELKGVNRVVTKTVEPIEITVDTETDTDINIPPIPPGAITKPTVKTERATPTPPTPTRVNNCQKGCRGAAPTGESTGTAGGLNTSGINTFNNLLLQNPLLKKIDETTRGTQAFMKTAWSSTLTDKALNTVSAVASLHNAAMLSQNAAQSLGDAVSSTLNSLGVKTPEGESIDANAIVGGGLKSLATKLFGTQGLNSLSTAWLNLNRIHQAVSSTVGAIQGTKNALLEADEITGGHLAEIGNALQDQGVIEEDTYDWMNPEPNYQEPFKGLLGKIEAIEDISDRISNVVQTGVEIKENIGEVATTSDELNQATQDFLNQFNTSRDAEVAASLSPTIDRLDLLKQDAPDENGSI